MAEQQAAIPPDIAGLPFEKALEELEATVAKMENERLPLETMISDFERGSRLALHCRNKLAELEKRIEVLTRDSADGGQWQEFKA